jgi:hypothetical protein
MRAECKTPPRWVGLRHILEVGIPLFKRFRLEGPHHHHWLAILTKLGIQNTEFAIFGHGNRASGIHLGITGDFDNGLVGNGNEGTMLNVIEN